MYKISAWRNVSCWVKSVPDMKLWENYIIGRQWKWYTGIDKLWILEEQHKGVAEARHETLCDQKQSNGKHTYQVSSGAQHIALLHQ